MLCLSNCGFTTREVTEMMNKSADTVNLYRQNVYESLEVDNIAKAVAHAVHYGII